MGTEWLPKIGLHELYLLVLRTILSYQRAPYTHCTLFQLKRIFVACWSSSYRLNHHTNTLGLDFGWGALGCKLDRTLTFDRCLWCFQIQQHRRQGLAAKEGAAGLKHPLLASSHRTKSSPTVFSVFKNKFFLYIYIHISLKYNWLTMFQVHSKVIQL